MADATGRTRGRASGAGDHDAGCVLACSSPGSDASICPPCLRKAGRCQTRTPGVRIDNVDPQDSQHHCIESGVVMDPSHWLIEREALEICKERAPTSPRAPNGFTDEERAAMQGRADELKAAARQRGSHADNPTEKKLTVAVNPADRRPRSDLTVDFLVLVST